MTFFSCMGTTRQFVIMFVPIFGCDQSRSGGDLVTISSPCGPWSTASTSQGLVTSEGQLMLHSILERRLKKATFIAIENVAGFAGHPHKSVTERALRWIGYRIIQLQKTLDAKQAMGITRARWLR